MTSKKPNLKRKDLLYPELSYQIIGILFDIYNSVGYGYQEKYYQRAIAVKLKQIDLSFKEQVPIKINLENNEIGRYFIDFVIRNKVALEIKKEDKFQKSNIEQLYAYLKGSRLKLGILANFTKRGLQFKRVVNLNS